MLEGLGWEPLDLTASDCLILDMLNRCPWVRHGGRLLLRLLGSHCCMSSIASCEVFSRLLACRTQHVRQMLYCFCLCSHSTDPSAGADELLMCQTAHQAAPGSCSTHGRLSVQTPIILHVNQQAGTALGPSLLPTQCLQSCHAAVPRAANIITSM